MAEIDERFLNLDAHGVLRIPLELWAAVLFLARGWVIALFTAASVMSNQKDVLYLLSEDTPWIGMLIELPAIVALWLFANRNPEAGIRVRQLWPYVRHFIIAAGVGNIAYVIGLLWYSAYWTPWPELFWVSCSLIDIAICWGIYSSPHLQQVLLELPKAKSNE